MNYVKNWLDGGVCQPRFSIIAQLSPYYVMYGQVVEMAPTSLPSANPTHEYTRIYWVLYFQLKSATRLYQIPGSVPSPYDFAVGTVCKSFTTIDANPDQKLILTAGRRAVSIYGLLIS